MKLTGTLFGRRTFGDSISSYDELKFAAKPPPGERQFAESPEIFSSDNLAFHLKALVTLSDNSD